MDGRLAIGATVLGLVLATGSPAAAQQTSAPTHPGGASKSRTSSGEVLSPLHAFLGIDPITGEFKPAGGSRRPTSASGNSASKPAESPPANATNTGETSTDFPVDDASLEDFRAAISKAIDEQDDAALAANLANLTRGMRSEQFSLLDPRIERLGYLALFLYPLGIVLSELYGAWARRRMLPRMEPDRRFYARQRGRRFMLAACSAATIALFWWAGEHGFWWSEPRRLVAFLVSLTLLASIAALLRLMVARAAKEFVARTIEDLRLQQANLEKEIQELRRRLQGDVLPDIIA